MKFELSAALLAGLLAGAAMLAYRAALRLAGLRLELDVARLWGTMLVPPGSGSRAMGLTIHLVGSGLLALPYAWAFSSLGIAREEAWSWGLLGGAVHWLIAGATMGVAPRLHPRIPGAQRRPGWFVTRFGWPSAVVFVGGHLLYGLLVAALYAWLA